MYIFPQCRHLRFRLRRFCFIGSSFRKPPMLTQIDSEEKKTHLPKKMGQEDEEDIIYESLEEDPPEENRFSNRPV
jgi:hypothetical protein